MLMRHKRRFDERGEHSARNQAGFTFIELMVALAVLGVILALGVPSFREATASSNLRSATINLISALNTARAQAVGLRSDIEVKPLVGVDWSDGWLIDYPATLVQEGDQTFKAYPRVTVTEAASVTALTFNSRGLVSAAASFDICDDRSGERGRRVTMNLLGRVTSAELICP